MRSMLLFDVCAGGVREGFGLRFRGDVHSRDRRSDWRVGILLCLQGAEQHREAVSSHDSTLRCRCHLPGGGAVFVKVCRGDIVL
jgi:hypothetical protein